MSVAQLCVHKLLVVIHQVHSIASCVSSYMESYDDQYVSYDPLPYGLLAAEVTKEPAHVTNPHDPALWTHHLRHPQIQAHLLRDPQVLHYHSSLAYAYDAHSQRLIEADSRLSL